MKEVASTIEKKPANELAKVIWPALPFLIMCTSQNLQSYTRGTKWEALVSNLSFGALILLAIVSLVVGIRESNGGVWNRQASRKLGLILLAGLVLLAVVKGLSWLNALVGVENILVGLLILGIVGAGELLILAIKGKV